MALRVEALFYLDFSLPAVLKPCLWQAGLVRFFSSMEKK